jgi:hypothetical protein
VRRHDRERDERGVFMVLWSLMLVALISMVAIVVDLGHLRAGARVDQSVADLAALAGSKNLADGHFDQACRDVVNYLNVNAPDMPAINPGPFCAQTGNNVSQTVCSGYLQQQAVPSTTSGRYRVEIHFPVPATEIADPVYGAGVNDGAACQRMRVIVSSEHTSFFAGVVGVSSLRTARSATAKAGIGLTKPVPALWLLDPYGCVALGVSGGSQITVGDATTPGLVTVDSNGSTCGSNQFALSASGNNTKLRALPTSGANAGSISLFAMQPNAVACAAPACNPADVTGGRVAPQPVRAAERATRGPVDWKFNCKPSPDGESSPYPKFHGIDIDACEGGTPPYIDNLVSAVGTSGAPGGSLTGYARWTSSYSCSPSGTVNVAAGNWWIDCAGGLAVSNGTSITFPRGNVVFDGGLNMTGGSLTFNGLTDASTLPTSCRPPVVLTPCLTSSSSGAAFVYVRAGDWNITGGNLTVHNAAVYQRNGFVKIAGGAPPVWHAPTEGPLAGLALWSEAASNKFQLNGGAGVDLQGTFFTPEAVPFTLNGGGNWGQLRAQFIAFQLSVSSNNAVLSMAPDPNNGVPLPPRPGILIR